MKYLLSIVCPDCGYDPFVKRAGGEYGCARCGLVMSKEALLVYWREVIDQPDRDSLARITRLS